MEVESESEVAQSCPTLRDPMDCSLLGSSAHGIFQARVLEWVAIVTQSRGQIRNHGLLCKTTGLSGPEMAQLPEGSSSHSRVGL